tara:strand:+ start:7645 stop:7806 length:162 start_codon:yes stop_codon:yes gene_type:complete
MAADVNGHVMGGTFESGDWSGFVVCVGIGLDKMQMDKMQVRDTFELVGMDRSD